MLALLTGCDLGEPDSQATRGADLHVIATYPRDGQGLECAVGDVGCGVPTNVELELAVDRFLWPAGLPTRQAIKIFSGNEQNRTLDFEPDYDVVGRVLKFRLLGELRYAPNTLYTVEVIQPPEKGPGDGLRAYDGAPLRPGPVPLKFNFFTGSDPQELSPAAAAPTCENILSTVFSNCRGCHRADAEQPAPMDLRLDSARELAFNVVGRVAHGADIGPRVGKPLANPPRVGAQMPRIDPGFPANSYLLYKVLRKPENFKRPDTACLESAARLGLAVEQRCGPPSTEEIAGLREWFVRGEPMPLPLEQKGAITDVSWTRAQLVQLQDWIRAGAKCP